MKESTKKQKKIMKFRATVEFTYSVTEDDLENYYSDSTPEGIIKEDSSILSEAKEVRFILEDSHENFCLKKIEYVGQTVESSEDE